MEGMTTPWAGDAMDTLKMKIGLLTKEGKESSAKMEAAEAAKAEADARIAEAEKKVKELSKQIHARKILLDENTDKLLRNTSQARKKEEAMVAAREEMKAQTLREMALKAELERVSAALPASQAEVAAASERADLQLAEVKRLEIRAMLTDQTLEEMEQQVGEARSMATNTGTLAEDTARQLGVRTRELGHTRDREAAAASKLGSVQDSLRQVDRKMAGIQYTLEERAHQEARYRKQIAGLKERVSHAEKRSGREEDSLVRLQARMEAIGLRRRAREQRAK